MWGYCRSINDVNSYADLGITDKKLIESFESKGLDPKDALRIARCSKDENGFQSLFYALRERHCLSRLLSFYGLAEEDFLSDKEMYGKNSAFAKLTLKADFYALKNLYISARKVGFIRNDRFFQEINDIWEGMIDFADNYRYYTQEEAEMINFMQSQLGYGVPEKLMGIIDDQVYENAMPFSGVKNQIVLDALENAITPMQWSVFRVHLAAVFRAVVMGKKACSVSYYYSKQEEDLLFAAAQNIVGGPNRDKVFNALMT